MPPHHPWSTVHDTAYYAAEQTGALDIAGYAQIPDGVSLPVKGTGIGTGFTRADGRPFLIIQINVRSQHSADFGFIWGFGIIHLIPEPFQPLGGGNLIGVVLRAAAGGKRGGAGDRTVEYQYGFSP